MIKEFDNYEKAYNYAQKQTRYRIKSGQIAEKLTEKQKEAGMSPKLKHIYRVVTYNRNKELK